MPDLLAYARLGPSPMPASKARHGAARNISTYSLCRLFPGDTHVLGAAAAAATAKKGAAYVS